MNLKHYLILFISVLYTSAGLIAQEDPDMSKQWWLNDDVVNVKAAWDAGYTGSGVNVGVFDSGVSDHVDLLNNIAGSFPGGADDGADPVSDHGTNVAGVIAAERNTIGGRGMAYNAKLYNVDIFENDGDFGLTVATLYEGTNVNSGTGVISADPTLDIRNHSWGNTFWYVTGDSEPGSATWTAIERTALNNVIDVKSAGNSRADLSGDGIDDNGLSSLEGMDNHPDVIVVGALGTDMKYADFSSYGSNLMITAPGTQIYTSDGTDSYKTTQGTSFSAPMVSGAIALAKEAVPDANSRLIKHAIVRSADVVDASDSNPTGGWVTNAAGYQFNNNYGFGNLDTKGLIDATLNAAYVTKETARSETASFSQNVGGTDVSQALTFNASANDTKVNTVLVTLTFGSPVVMPGASGTITSPSGTVHKFLTTISNADGKMVAHTGWTFAVNGFWGENIAGNWTVTLNSPDETVTWTDLGIEIYHSDYVEENGSLIDIATNESIYSMQLDESTTSVLVRGGITLTTDHDIRINAGTLTNQGIIQKGVSPTIGLYMQNSISAFTNSGTATFDKGISNSGGAITNSGTLTTAASTTVSNGGSLNNSGTFSTTDLTASAATLTNSGTLTATGNISLAGNTKLTTSGTTNTTTLDVSESTVTNSGTLTATTLNLASDSTFTNSNSATFTSLSHASSAINNSGTMTLGGGSAALSLSSGSLNNSGTLNAGNLSGSDSAITNSGTLDLTGGTGAVNLSSGSLTNSGTLNGGSLTADSAELANSGTIDLSSGSGAVSVSKGSVDNKGGNITGISDMTLSETTFNNVSGTLTFNGVGSSLALNRSELTDSGNTIVALDSLSIGGGSTLTHTSSNPAGSTLANTVTNAGSLNVTAVSLSATDIINTGVFTLSTSTVNVTNAFNSSGTLKILQPATTINANSILLSGRTESVVSANPHVLNATTSAQVGGTLYIAGQSGLSLTKDANIVVFSAPSAGLTGAFEEILWSTDAVNNLIFTYSLNTGLTNTSQVVLTYKRDFTNSILAQYLNDNQKSLSASLAAMDDANASGTDTDLALDAFNGLSSAGELLDAMNQLMPIDGETQQLLARTSARGQMSRMSNQTRNHWIRHKTIRKFIDTHGFSPVDEYDELAAALLNEQKAVKYDPLADSYYVVNNNKRLKMPYQKNFRFGFGVSGAYQMGSHGNSVGGAGYDFDHYAMTANFNVTIGDHLMAGLLLGADRGSSDQERTTNEVDMNAYSFGTFVSGAYSRIYADLAFAYSLLRYDMQRNVNFGGLSQTFESEPKGRQYTAYANMGVDIPLSENFNVGPTFAMQYIDWKMKGYTEAGSHPYALQVSDVDAQSLWLDMGGRVSFFKAWDSLQLLTNMDFSISKDLMEEALSVSSNFVNAPGSRVFTTSSLEDDTYLFNVGTGFELIFYEHTNFSVDLGYTVGDNYDAYSIEASLGHRL